MSDGEEVDWGPDDEVVLEGEWNPKALDLLKENPDFAKYKAERPFRFVHLFSGPRDVLKEALMTEAKKEGISLKVESYDKLAEGAQN